MSFASTVTPLPHHATKVFTGELFSVWQWEQELYDGTTATFERISRPDAAAAVAILPDQKILMLREEQPDRGVLIGSAAGRVESGETPQAAAARELEEETGYRAETVSAWYQYRPSIKVEMTVHCFVARNLKKIGEQNLEAGERIEPIMLTFDEFLELGHEPLLRDWMLRIILLEAKLDPLKKAALRHLFYGPE